MSYINYLPITDSIGNTIVNKISKEVRVIFHIFDDSVYLDDGTEISKGSVDKNWIRFIWFEEEC